jgi:hypothetical protein
LASPESHASDTAQVGNQQERSAGTHTLTGGSH